MNGTIICTVDDSAGVAATVEVARRIAERFGARLLLVSIADGPTAHTATGERLGASESLVCAQQRLARILAEHDLPPEAHRIAAGDPAEAVAVIAAEEAADLVVVGARRGVLGRTLRSALARELAATASCPVVVAPPEPALAVAGRSAADVRLG
jgi:nucleotide-binding universal stress UspA family protein